MKPIDYPKTAEARHDLVRETAIEKERAPYLVGGPVRDSSSAPPRSTSISPSEEEAPSSPARSPSASMGRVKASRSS